MQDSDSRFDVASPIHNASSDRILELEETLEGKELALRMMQQELEDANKAMEEAQDHAQSVQADAQAAARATPPNNIDAHQQAGDNHHWQSASIQVCRFLKDVIMNEPPFKKKLFCYILRQLFPTPDDG